MTLKGYEQGGKYADDPIGSEKPRGKDCSERRSSRDPGFTATEQHRKNSLMRQFMRNPEGGGIGNSAPYRAASCWCACGKRLKAEPLGTCAQCAVLLPAYLMAKVGES